MTRREQLKNKRITKITAAILMSIALLFGVWFSFATFKSNIEDELNENAGEGIEETYKEVGQLITSISQSRINYLNMLGDYLETSNFTDNESFVTTVEKYRELCSFTQFYFLNDDGYFMTINGIDGYLDFTTSLDKLNSVGRQGIVVDGSLPSRDEMIFYVVNTADGTFNDFDYTGIAFGYDKQDMVNSLKIDAYNGEGISYIIYSNGKIVCRIDSDTKANNIFTILQNSQISEEDYNRVESEISQGLVGTVRIVGKPEVEGFGEYYFSYQSLDYQNWILVSMVPVEAVNRTINTVVNQTQTVIIAIFSCVLIILLAALVLMFRSAMKNKDGLIIQRNIVFDLVCNNLNEIYILFNTMTKQIEYISPNTEKLLGVSHDDIYDDPKILDIYKDDKATPLDKLINNFIEKEMYDFRDDVYLKNKYDKQVLYSLTTYRQANDLYGVVVLSDRTEENKIRQELQDALEGARSANEAKTAFLSSVSHDMRTPMNAIVGFSNLIEKDPYNGEQVMDYIMKIKMSSDHLLSLINEVLDYSKIEAGKTTLNLDPINIETVVNRIDSLIRPQTIEKGLTFNVKKHFSSHCMVKADELRLSQIIINMLSNSIKYTPEGGTVTFDVTSEKYHQYMRYIFVVEDTGVGMSKEFISKIFEPFSREVDSTTNKIQGTGLGMSITKNLIDLMGGTIDVESTKGKGSKFTLTLLFEELQEVDELAKKTTKETDESFSIEGLNILAAEDNELNAEIIKAILEAEGAKITVAQNGKECLETFEASKHDEYDLILMDVQMPIMNGYDATMAIRACKHEDAKNIPIIAMTANAFTEDVNNSLKAGMNAHVSKPIDLNILKKTIKECLNSKATS